MPCYHPVKAHQVAPGAQPTFPKTPPWNLKLPCGRCIGCRLERSKQWAIRLMNEAQMHEKTSFITLTYHADALTTSHPEREPTVPCTPPSNMRGRAEIEYASDAQKQSTANGHSLRKRDAQLFLKRLRKHLTTQNPSTRVRYYLVGEYGEKKGRPHYHAALFGENFSQDRYFWRMSPSGNRLYRSNTLEKLWPHGHAEIGDLTFQSAAYIARYIMKKVNGAQAKQHYKRTDPHGSIYWITPEFALMSRRPGIGENWIKKYGQSDVYLNDYVIMNGQKHKPPRYYDKLLAKIDEEYAVLQKLEREFTSRSKEADNTPRRLRAKEKVALARAALSKKTLE